VSPAAEIAAFAGIMLLGQFSPGPDMLLLTRTALADGAQAGVKTALGIATGLAIHAALAVLGLAWLLEKFPLFGQIMRWAAAAYLLWLAWKLLSACVKAFSRNEGEKITTPFAGSYYQRGLWCNLLNPKVVVFLAAVTAPFLRGDPSAARPLALWLIIVIQGGALWSLWAVVLQWRPLRDGYRKAQPLIDGAFGIVLLALAAMLVIGK
jgi:threonine/homoserine/homoserine lactone efflux protein